MNRIVPALAVAAVSAVSAAPALAKKCDIVYSFTDSLGSSGKFTTEKKGTVSNPAICPSTYKLKVTKLTTKVIDITGTTSACGNLTGDFTFNDSCDSASGTVTIAGIGSFADTVTRSGKAAHTAPDNSLLTTGLK